VTSIAAFSHKFLAIFFISFGLIEKPGLFRLSSAEAGLPHIVSSPFPCLKRSGYSRWVVQSAFEIALRLKAPEQEKLNHR
jgi:hypothetical protein